jgi:hypothetical protein
MKGGTCPHCGRFLHEPVRGRKVLPPIVAGVALAIALLLPGCASGMTLEGGFNSVMEKGVHVSWSIPTVTWPRTHTAIEDKIHEPY